MNWLIDFLSKEIADEMSKYNNADQIRKEFNIVNFWGIYTQDEVKKEISWCGLFNNRKKNAN
jgi:hypothetical protein